ncbi:low temperature requirement protein A [Nocardia sp. NPDC051030]|uniref:low temperature requirement protein A n=1 Tax=Nocardia sp. NPDC051030 TaxID=3155162 RepID=UPI0034323DE7
MVNETSAEGNATHERHASWMELFFDLVAVAGIGQLTHLLHRGPSLGDFGLYVVLYLAFWMVWASITMYGNIARDHTKLPFMLAAMLGLGVMAAAVAGIPERHATAFAAIFVIVRIGSDQIFGRGRIVVDWPTVQLGAGTLPWVVSLWVGEPGKYWLWAAGMAIDLWVMFAVSGELFLENAQKRLDNRLEQLSRKITIDPDRVPKYKALRADPAHLGERLGLYVIIVLGEGIIAVINAVGGVAWDAKVLGLGFAAFVILAGLWALTLMYGFVPRLMGETDLPRSLPWQHIMLGHCGLTGAIATLAAGLGLAIDHAEGHLTTGIGWALCGGAAAYFLITALAGARSGAGWRWTLIWPLPCALIAVILGAASPHLGALPIVCGLTALVLWPLLWETWSAGKWRTNSRPARPHRTPHRES